MGYTPNPRRWLTPPFGSPLEGEGSKWRFLLATLLALFAVLALGLAPAHAALTFPALNNQRVVDDAHLLPAAEKAALEDKLKALEDKTSRQLVIVTLPSLQGDDIADYGYQLGRTWGIGQKGQNNGVLFIVAPTEHKVRIEVGYGMEGVLTDALTSVILQTQVLPKFKAGDFPGGIEAGTDALVEQMQADPSTAEQKLADAKAQSDQMDESSSRRHLRGGPSPFIFLFPILFFFVTIGGIFRRNGRGGAGGLWPLLFLGGLGGGGGGRDDDWGGGGGGGGGGFSGGGGSFGGGGSSGSW